MNGIGWMIGCLVVYAMWVATVEYRMYLLRTDVRVTAAAVANLLQAEIMRMENSKNPILLKDEKTHTHESLEQEFGGR